MPVSPVQRATTSSASSSSSVLRQGSHGAAVSDLQRLLKAKGYNVSVDGAFGPNTAAAVKRFQSAQHLTADGIVGPKTWAALRGGAAAASPAPSVGSPVLRQGAHGAAVSELQRLLKAKGQSVAVDGAFGPGTAGAVKRFQSSHGLSADGVVGPKTWAALRGTAAPSSSGTSSSSGPSKTVEGWVQGRRTTVKVSYVGSNEWMNSKCAGSYKDMLADARRAGVFLGTTDGYRTYAEQAALYRRYGSGRAARPGYSNHQMGLSADISGIGGYGTRAYRWLQANAGRYGFVNDVRGEPWHWTYKR